MVWCSNRANSFVEPEFASEEVVPGIVPMVPSTGVTDEEHLERNIRVGGFIRNCGRVLTSCRPKPAIGVHAEYMS